MKVDRSEIVIQSKGGVCQESNLRLASARTGAIMGCGINRKESEVLINHLNLFGY
jgi:hypothetical protein